MLQSVFANLSSDRRLAVHVVDGGIEERHRLDLMRWWHPDRVSLRFLAAKPETLAGLPLWGRMSVATYYKLLITQLLPSAVSRAIWLDCDLVVTADLGRLWDTDLGGRHALAVQDHAVPFVSSPNGVSQYERLGLPADAGYFNAGVMLLDLGLLRRDEIPARAIEYLLQHRDTVVFWDQEALNAMLAGKWGALDPRWNHIPNPRCARPSEGQDGNWIYHFAGNVKPWAYPSAFSSHALYYHYVDQTPWAGWRPKRSLAGTLIATYAPSRLRTVLYPTEEWLMTLLRTLTRKYAHDA
jgi:lipopolysaccharide biosynthesis glycosyltransferase